VPLRFVSRSNQARGDIARARWLERKRQGEQERAALAWANCAVSIYLTSRIREILSHPSPTLAAAIRANEQLVLNAISNGWREKFVLWYKDLEFAVMDDDDLAGEIERRIRQANEEMRESDRRVEREYLYWVAYHDESTTTFGTPPTARMLEIRAEIERGRADRRAQAERAPYPPCSPSRLRLTGR